MSAYQKWDRGSMEEIHKRFDINIKVWGEDEIVFEQPTFMLEINLINVDNMWYLLKEK
jgi:hypothetical protein